MQTKAHSFIVALPMWRKSLALVSGLLLIAIGIIGVARTRAHSKVSTADKIAPDKLGKVEIPGNIRVRIARNGNIVLIFDSGVIGYPDGVPDLAIRFAPVQPINTDQMMPAELLGVVLSLHKRQVLVTDREGFPRIQLSLDATENTANNKQRAQSIKVLSETLFVPGGYALQRQTIERLPDGSAEEVDLERDILTRAPVYGLSSLPCTAGGRGATSSSYSCGGQSYEVSCGSGAYACCGCNSNGRSSVPYCSCQL